jgi:carbonic anhydrase/acetyltransferase-like protein (isoleucine patch superfamily)
MPAYSFEGVTPVVHPAAFVHETAVLIGDVWIGEGSYIGPNAVLRGDFGRVVLGKGANFQDTCVAHSFPGRDCIVEDGGHIGHGTVLHGCTVGRQALVGMNSVLMDEVVIGVESIVGAMSLPARPEAWWWVRRPECCVRCNKRRSTGKKAELRNTANSPFAAMKACGRSRRWRKTTPGGSA